MKKLRFANLVTRKLAHAAQPSLLTEDRGSALLEFALMLPMLVLLMVGAVDFGRAWYVNLEVANAAEAGALYGTQNPSDMSGMKAAAALDAAELPALQVSSTYGSECSDGTGAVTQSNYAPNCTSNSVEYVEVNTTLAYKPILAYPGISSLMTMTGKSRMRTTF